MANYQSAYTGAQIDTAIERMNNILNVIYPVGSIYISVNSTDPGTLFGGTWEMINEKFLLAGSSTNYPYGSTGGAATVTLSANQMPSHYHSTTGISVGSANSARTWLSLQADGNLVVYNSGNTARWSSNSINTNDNFAFRPVILGQNSSTATDSKGSGAAHNNMPPYLSVYMWKRIS